LYNIDCETISTIANLDIVCASVIFAALTWLNNAVALVELLQFVHRAGRVTLRLRLASIVIDGAAHAAAAAAAATTAGWMKGPMTDWSKRLHHHTLRHAALFGSAFSLDNINLSMILGH